MDYFISAFVGIFIAFAFFVFLALIYWLVGLFLYQFEFSKFAGFKLMCMSGLFPKILPQLCPCPSCSGTPCGMWTCPRYSADNKKTGLP